MNINSKLGRRILLIVGALLCLGVIVGVFIGIKKKENFSNTPIKLLITKDGKSSIAKSFRFKMWDDSKWTAQIIDNKFYIRQRGSNDIHIVSTINILRFRSQQWQVTLNNKGDKFLVFRLNGIVGTLFQTLDMVDWDDYTYNVRII